MSDNTVTDNDLREFFNKALGMLCVAGFDGYFKELNPSWVATLGFTKEELTSKPFIEFVHPDDREATLAVAAGLTQGQEVVSFENRYQAKDGSYRWFNWTSAISVERELIYATVVDITEEKELKQSLVQNQRRLEEAQNLAKVGYWEWDMLSNELVWSNQVYHMFGVDKDEHEATYENYIAAVHPDDRELLQTALQETIETKGSYALEHRVLQPNGTVSYIFARGNIFVDSAGNPTRMSGSVQNVTAEKEAVLQQEQMQEQLIMAQQRIIDELSVPIIPLMDEIIVMPLIGSIDSMRARDLMRTMLKGISTHRAKIIILDVTGVSLVDTGIVGLLDRTIQAARLKGARTIVTGLSDAVAETIVDLGINWSNVETLRDLQTGLTVAMAQLQRH